MRGAGSGCLLAPFFLVSIGLNTWASVGYLHQLGWEFVGGEQVPWPSSLAPGRYGWLQDATFVITGLLILVLAAAVRDDLPRRRASAVAVGLLALLGVALILAGFRVDVPMLSGGSPATWDGWLYGTAFLLIITLGGLAPLAMAVAVTPRPELAANCGPVPRDAPTIAARSISDVASQPSLSMDGPNRLIRENVRLHSVDSVKFRQDPVSRRS